MVNMKNGLVCSSIKKAKVSVADLPSRRGTMGSDLVQDPLELKQQQDPNKLNPHYDTVLCNAEDAEKYTSIAQVLESQPMYLLLYVAKITITESE